MLSPQDKKLAEKFIEQVDGLGNHPSERAFNRINKTIAELKSTGAIQRVRDFDPKLARRVRQATVKLEKAAKGWS